MVHETNSCRIIFSFVCYYTQLWYYDGYVMAFDCKFLLLTVRRKKVNEFEEKKETDNYKNIISFLTRECLSN